LSIQCEWNQGRASFNDFQSKLPRHTIAEIRRADFWDGQSAGCDDERTAFNITQVARQQKRRVLFNPADGAVHANLRASCGAVLQKHFDDLLRRAVAEELSKLFLVISDMVPSDRRDEIFGGVPGER